MENRKRNPTIFRGLGAEDQQFLAEPRCPDVFAVQSLVQVIHCSPFPS